MDEIDSAVNHESTARVGFNRRLDIGFELDELQIKSNSAAKPGPISNVGFNRRWHRALNSGKLPAPRLKIGVGDISEIDSAVDNEPTASVGFNRRLDIRFELDKLQIESNSAVDPEPISNVGFNRRWHRAG
jgi:hypothetical protein